MTGRHLVAQNGYILTNGHIYCHGVILGCDDRDYNWWEITEEEYARIREAAITENNIEYASYL